MKKLNVLSILSYKYVKYALLLTGGILIGWLLFHHPAEKTIKAGPLSEEVKGTIWTCSMHPQIRMTKPGKCPICGMELIPLVQSSTSMVDPDAIHLSKEAAALANVLTSKVTRQKPVKEVRLYGKVQADERLFQSQTSHVPGRIERLFVNFTGEQVSRGQVLAEIYSPELINAQEELLETVKTKKIQPGLYEAAREKLRQWKLTDDQIAKIENSGIVQNNFDVLSNTSGTVIARRVNSGDHISEGTVLFDIADLSKVWIMFDAYETDLQFLHVGEKISFNIQALPGIDFTGNIIFIDPVIDPVTRVAKVRVETGNQSGKLKPEMFATGIASSTLASYADNVVIPKSAVLWTGKRSVVYVKQPGSDEPVFKIREVELGPMLGDSYVIINGLSEGEEIVTNGTFSVDAAAQLEGKPSMMNPGGGISQTMPGMDIKGDSKGISDITGDKTGKNSIGQGVMIEVNMNFKMQLDAVFDQYILLKNALVKSDFDMVRKTAQGVKASLLKVDMELLAGDAHNQWMSISAKLEDQIKKIISAGQMEEARIVFSNFSDQLYKTIKTFGLMGKTVYYQFCPMAENGKGAFWLSETKDIRNPYFGDSMLTCGETRETLKY